MFALQILCWGVLIVENCIFTHIFAYLGILKLRYCIRPVLWLNGLPLDAVLIVKNV
jgi:hypothetical protein